MVASVEGAFSYLICIVIKGTMLDSGNTTFLEYMCLSKINPGFHLCHKVGLAPKKH